MKPFKLFQALQINITAHPCKTSTASSILTQATKHIAFQPGLIPLNQESKQFLSQAINEFNPKSIEDQLDQTSLNETSSIQQVKDHFIAIIKSDPSFTLNQYKKLLDS